MVRPRSLVVAVFISVLAVASLHAGDLRIPLPKRSKYTPVQALNRDGVKAVEKHEYARAKKLFYKAYLIDPNDPFTLNNLGYMAELDGDSDRARRFYALSAEMGSDAVIDKANNDVMEGKPVSVVAGRAEDKGIKVNRLNNQAISLLQKDRAPEADLVLQKALIVDPQNPFTLNNLGYAKEKEGEIEAAYQFYSAAADRDSKERVEVAVNKDWRGRPISDVARDNAHKLNRRMRNGNDVESRVAILNLRGVSALNRNDRRTGRDFIQKAFKLDPQDAFTLNNMGYLAEMDGDKETADFYYERAREANQKNARIVVATRKEVEGKKIGDVANTTDQLVQSQMENARLAREQQGGPVILQRRDNSAVVEPPKPLYTPKPQIVSDAYGNLQVPVPKGVTAPVASSGAIAGPASSQPQPDNGGLMMPLPGNDQPTTVKEGNGTGNGGLMMPLPDDAQPGSQPAGQPTAQPAEAQPDSGMTMPLPEDNQPNTDQPASPLPSQHTIVPQPAAPQPQTQIKQGQDDGGMIMPLPDTQQPNQQPGTQQPSAPQSAAPQSAAPQSSLPQPGAPQSNVQPQNAQPMQPTAPPVAQPTQPAPSSQPPLLLPPPDNQSAPQSNTGVYTPPPASSNPGNYSSKPAQPNHISDTDQAKSKQQQQQQPNSSAPKKISDEN